LVAEGVRGMLRSTAWADDDPQSDRRRPAGRSRHAAGLGQHQRVMARGASRACPGLDPGVRAAALRAPLTRSIPCRCVKLERQTTPPV